MNRKLSSYIVQLIQEACLKSFWYKRALKSFLRRHHISENALAASTGELKREYLYHLFDTLCEQKDNKGQALMLQMARDLASQTAFPDLKNVEGSEQKIGDAKEPIRLLAAELKKLDAQLKDENDRRARREQAAERRAKTIRAAESLPARLTRVSFKLHHMANCL